MRYGCRIASGLLFGHIVAHGLYGIFESTGLAGDQTSDESSRGSRVPVGSGVAKALSPGVVEPLDATPRKGSD
jgi:hypothetical protein